MRKSVLVRQVLPSILGYVLLVLAAIGADFLFHRIGLGWIGRYFGISGSVLIAGSFAYSLRKRKILHRGSPKALLDLHVENCARCHRSGDEDEVEGRWKESERWREDEGEGDE